MFNLTDKLAAQLKVLSDANRLRILALCRNGEVSVGELVEILGLSQPRVSQHLKALCDARLLGRFRDGKKIFYRLPRSRDASLKKLLALLPDDDGFGRDAERLRALRGTALEPADRDDERFRTLGRALIELTVAAPVGDLIDIGCGRGQVLKLLAGRANRAVGVDIDADARNIARAAVFVAGLENCSLRSGNMYRLPFADASFDTVILDDVLADADDAPGALGEAGRLLKPTGRLVVLSQVGPNASDFPEMLAEHARSAGLRMGPPRLFPAARPEWLLSVLTRARADAAAA